MKASKDTHRKSFVLLILFWTILGCTHQAVVNSPCATLNAEVHFKPRADLELVFGNDAIKAAVEAVTEGFAKGAITSVSNLTDVGKNAAAKTAKANGKTPSSTDIAELDRYLRKAVVPAITQNPNCNFTVISMGKPYIGIEQIALSSVGEKQIPRIVIKNTGQTEATCHVVMKATFGGKTESGSTDLLMGPSQTKGLSLQSAILPMPDIEAGKTSLLIAVEITYPREGGGTPITSQETWRYEHVTKGFILISQK